MEAHKLSLPLSLRVVRLAAQLMMSLDLPPTRLDEDSVCENARKEAGLSDFGDPYFREGLQELLKSCLEEADLHPIGRLVTRDLVTNFLIQRLRLVETRKRDPEIFTHQLIPPIVVTGMARSGTTFLHNLLALDPAHRAIPQWQLMRPFPEKDGDPDEPDPRIAKMERANKIRRPMLPGLDSKHHTRAETAEECIIALGLTFNSLFFPTMLPIPGYMKWYLGHAEATQTVLQNTGSIDGFFRYSNTRNRSSDSR